MSLSFNELKTKVKYTNCNTLKGMYTKSENLPMNFRTIFFFFQMQW